VKKRINTFLYVFRQSLFNPQYYTNVLKAPFFFSFKYFTALFLVLSLLTSLAASFFINQEVKPYFNRLEKQLPSFYPADLQITIENGRVNTNVQEPFFIPLDPDLFPDEFGQALKQQPVQNILVINTQAHPSDLDQYQTIALLTKDSLAIIQDKNDIRVFSLKDVQSFTVNQKIVSSAWNRILPYFRWLIPILILIIFLTVPTVTIATKFLYLALFSLIPFLISKVLKIQDLSFIKALQVNLHALTLPTVIAAGFQLLGVVPQIPLFQTIILLIYNLIILTSLKPIKSTKKSK
jgi:hypothetical protein